MPIFEFERDEDGRERLVDVSSNTATFEQKEEDIHVDIIAAPATESTTHSVRFLRLLDLDRDRYIQIRAPDILSQNWKYILPSVDGVSGSHLETDGVGNLKWSASGGVLSAGPSLVNSLAVWSNASGTLLKDSNIIITNDDEVKDINTLDMVNNLTVSAGDITAELGDIKGFDIIADNEIKINDTGSGFEVSLDAPVLTANTAYTFPNALPVSNNQVLASTTGGVMSWQDSDPAGVDSSSIPAVDNRLCLYDSTSGVLIKESGSITITAGTLGDDINTIDKVNCQRLRLNNDAFSNYIQFETLSGLSSNFLHIIDPTKNINDGIWKVSSVGNMNITQQMGISGEGLFGVDSITMQTASNSWTAGGTLTTSTGVSSQALSAETNINLNSGARIRFQGAVSGNRGDIEAPDNITTYTLKMPVNPASANDDFLVSTVTTNNLSFKSASALDLGDVSSSINFANDNRLIKSDATSPSKDLQQSGIILDDSNNISGLNGLSANGTAQILLQSSLASASAIKLNATAGDIDIDGTDIDILASKTSSDANLTLSTVGNIADTITLSAFTSTSANSIKLESFNGGINLISSADTVIETVTFNNGAIDEVHSIRIQGDDGLDSFYTKILASSTSADFTIGLPSDEGIAGQFIQTTTSGASAELKFADVPLPIGYIFGFDFQFSSVSSVDIGTSGETSKCRDFADTVNLEISGITNVSFASNLSSTYTEAADTSYDVYIVFDSTGVTSQTFLIIEADDDITTVAEFTGGTPDFDLFRRLGWFRNDSSSSILEFITQGKGNNRVYYWNVDRDDVIVLTDGNSPIFLDVDLSSFMGMDSRSAILRGAFGDINGTTVVNATGALRTNGSSSIIEQTMVTISAGNALSSGALMDAHLSIITDTSQIIEYALTTAGDSLFLYMHSYIYGV